MGEKFLCCGFCLLLIMPFALHGQTTTPGTVLERNRQTQQIREEQERLRRLQEENERDVQPSITDQIPADTKELSGPSSVSFELKQINTTPSEILSRDEIDEIVNPYVGTLVGFDKINEIVNQLNRLYKSKNYIAARAYLPPQKIKDGIVNLRLVEGQIGVFKIENNISTNRNYILDRLPLASGDLVYAPEIEQKLGIFNRLNDIDLHAVLQPGEDFGTTDFVLKTLEPKRRGLTFYTDNAATNDIGRQRFGANYIDRSFSKRRDQLTLGGYLSEGSRGLYGGYRFQFSNYGSRLIVNADYSEIDIVDGALQDLNISGDSHNISVSLSQPYLTEGNKLLNFFIGANFKESTTDFSDVSLFNTEVNKISAGADIQSNSLGSSWYGRLTLSSSQTSFGSTDGFLKLKGDFSYLKSFENELLLTVRAAGQIADAELLPTFEQFQIGGSATVRGYVEGLLIGDDGYYLSFEFSKRFPGSLSSFFGDNSRYFAFVDHGGVFPFKGDGQSIDSDDFLSSAGFGIDMVLSSYLSGRLVAGFPLVGRDDDRDGAQLHMYVQFNPF